MNTNGRDYVAAFADQNNPVPRIIVDYEDADQIEQDGYFWAVYEGDFNYKPPLAGYVLLCIYTNHTKYDNDDDGQYAIVRGTWARDYTVTVVQTPPAEKKSTGRERSDQDCGRLTP